MAWGSATFNGSSSKLTFHPGKSYLDQIAELGTAPFIFIVFKPTGVAGLQGLVSELSAPASGIRRAVLRMDDNTIDGNHGFTSVSEFSNSVGTVSAGSWNLASRWHAMLPSSTKIWIGVNGNTYHNGSNYQTTLSNGGIEIGLDNIVGSVDNFFAGDVCAVGFATNNTFTDHADVWNSGDIVNLETFPGLEHLILFDDSTGPVDVLGGAELTATDLTYKTDATIPSSVAAYTATEVPHLGFAVHETEFSHGETEDSGNVPVGSVVSVPIEIVNTGSVTLNVSGFSVSGDLVFDYSDSFSPFSLLNGESRKIRVRLGASSVGEKSGSVTVASDDDDNANSVLNLEWTVDAVSPVAEPTLTKGAGGTPPAEGERTSYYPEGSWLLSPFAQVAEVGEEFFFGIIAAQEGGIRGIRYWWNGNTVVVNTLTVRNGLLGFWAKIVPGAVSGNEQIYATILAADPYAQEKVVPFPLYVTFLDGSSDVVHVGRPDMEAGLGTEASPFLSLDDARNALSLTNGGRVIFHEGNVEIPYGPATKVNSGVWSFEMASGEDRENVNYIFTGTASTHIRLRVHRLIVQGLYLPTNQVSWINNDGNEANAVFTTWKNNLINNPEGRLTLLGNHQNTKSVGSSHTREFTREATQENEFRDTFQGTQGYYSISDSCELLNRDISTSPYIVNLRGRRIDYGLLREQVNALSISYSGGATPTVSKTQVNASNNGRLILEENGTPVFQIKLRDSLANVVDTDPGDSEAPDPDGIGDSDAHTMAQVAALINAQPGWSATVHADYLALDESTRQLDGTYLNNGASPGAFTGVSVPVTLKVWSDNHADFIQSFDTGANPVPRFFFDCRHDQNPADLAATLGENQSDVQGLIMSSSNGTRDGGAYFISIVNAASSNVSQLSGTFENWRISHCTWAGTQGVSLRTDRTGSNEFIPTNFVIDNSAFQYLDNWEEDFDGELYLRNSTQVDNDWSGSGWGLTQSESVAEWSLDAEGRPQIGSTLGSKTLAGFTEWSLWPDGTEFSSDGSEAIGSAPIPSAETIDGTWVLFIPENLRRSFLTSSGDLRASLVTTSYSGGDPAGPEDLKASIVDSNGNLKPGLLLAGVLKPSVQPPA
ncbi:hypothetical protein KOR42_33030 [Thalassoglobus neptunius]|uniref:Uncharacterized protein n=1 Tax=Thalassoglobus neptunius TaxID=1938619 RepID=A0A5C5WMJ1_9PLAN|nr:choice-of-anchor D domain-containing protein [Thalassoglobus neptunius]TWT51830.1 hypothetical protein KOR42_33030 [Thalassoglobus neptunius]